MSTTKAPDAAWPAEQSKPNAVGQVLLLAITSHWREYLMEAAGLGLFMISACLFTILIFHPSSPVTIWLPSDVVRRTLMGLAMGSTAIGIIYSPWGKQSGAHLNPAVTLTFLRLEKIRWPDAFFYTLSQTLGGLAGVCLVALFAGNFLREPTVNYAATIPGPNGPVVACFVEFAISACLMFAVLCASNTSSLARFTGLIAGSIVATNIVIAAPLSGMSMNPARTLASAVPSGVWSAFWVYLSAPPLAMLTAAQAYLWLRGKHSVHCAKLHHENRHRCIFCGKPAGVWREP